jgi:hypothetical protein
LQLATEAQRHGDVKDKKDTILSVPQRLRGPIERKLRESADFFADVEGGDTACEGCGDCGVVEAEDCADGEGADSGELYGVTYGFFAGAHCVAPLVTIVRGFCSGVPLGRQPFCRARKFKFNGEHQNKGEDKFNGKSRFKGKSWRP